MQVADHRVVAARLDRRSQLVADPVLPVVIDDQGQNANPRQMSSRIRGGLIPTGHPY